MIEKKQALMVGIFGGMIFYVLPILVKSLEFAAPVFKWVGGIIMAGGVIYFIAGDVLTGKSGNYSKDIKKKLKSGEITPAQAFELEKKKLEQEILLERQKFELAKQKAEINKLKQSSKKPMDFGAITGQSGQQKSKMPDVLGNLGPVISGSKSSVDPLSNIEGMVKPTKDPMNSKSMVKEMRPEKKESNLDNLKDLF
jgi:hypothetical protein